MIKKIKNTLSLKVFIVTLVILVSTTFVTLLFFLYTASKTYIAELDKTLDKETTNFIKELETTSFKESGKLFDQYLLEHNVIITLYDSENKEIGLPTNAVSFPDNTTLTFDGVSASEGMGESQSEDLLFDFITKQYSFHFNGSGQSYKLDVTGNKQDLTEITNSITTVLPYWIIVVMLISFLASGYYSRFITKPIKELSKNSINMANLKFESISQMERTDEIGVLAHNLNLLSYNLSKTLQELKEANSLLLSDIEKERLIEKKRMEFFSSISHELKTPLTAIQGQLEGMIQGVGVYADREKYLRKALYTVHNMEGMVREMLTISRITSVETKLKLDENNMSLLISQICYELEDSAADNDIELVTQIKDNIIAEADYDLIKKILTNIIVNGIKYSSEKGKVIVALQYIEEIACFSCVNTKAHIPSSSIPNIFDAFYRVDMSRNRNTGGTGLGLYIVKTGLDLHKFNFSIKNVEDGVKFEIYFNKQESS